MLISSMMSLDRENAKTGQCMNADIWREAAKKAPQAVEAGRRTESGGCLHPAPQRRELRSCWREGWSTPESATDQRGLWRQTTSWRTPVGQQARG